RTLLGPRQPLLTERAEAARLLVLESFFVFPSLVVELLADPDKGIFGCAHLDATFPVADGPGGLCAAVERLRDEAQRLAGEGISPGDACRGAQIGGVAGRGPGVVAGRCAGTPSIVGAMGGDALGDDALTRHAAARLADGGFYRVRKRGEYHTHNDDVTELLNE